MVSAPAGFCLSADTDLPPTIDLNYFWDEARDARELASANPSNWNAIKFAIDSDLWPVHFNNSKPHEYLEQAFRGDACALCMSVPKVKRGYCLQCLESLQCHLKARSMLPANKENSVVSIRYVASGRLLRPVMRDFVPKAHMGVSILTLPGIRWASKDEDGSWQWVPRPMQFLDWNGNWLLHDNDPLGLTANIVNVTMTAMVTTSPPIILDESEDIEYFDKPLRNVQALRQGDPFSSSSSSSPRTPPTPPIQG